MKFSKKHIIMTGLLLTFCAGVIATLGKGLRLDANSTGNALLNKDAKDFKVRLVQSSKMHGLEDRNFIQLSDFKGKPLVLNFWASWCVSCRTEAYELEAFAEKYAEQGVQVVGIAIQDTEESAKEFISRYGKTYTIAMDLDGKAGINYGVTGVPETFFIGPDGLIKYKEAGPVTMKIMESKLPLILK